VDHGTIGPRKFKVEVGRKKKEGEKVLKERK
jgi:hypothetical protein